MHSVEVKTPFGDRSETIQGNHQWFCRSQLVILTKMIKLPRQRHNNKKLLLPGAGLGGSWFRRGEIAEINKSERSVEAKRYRPRYPLPTTIILHPRRMIRKR